MDYYVTSEHSDGQGSLKILNWFLLDKLGTHKGLEVEDVSR